MPKAPSRSTVVSRRHNPLAEDILSAGHLRTQSSRKNNRKSREAEDGPADREQFIEAKLSRKILQIGQELAEEDSIERGASNEEGQQNPAFDFDSRLEREEDVSEDMGDTGVDDDEWGDEEVEDAVSPYSP